MGCLGLESRKTCAGWPTLTLPISPSGTNPRRYTLRQIEQRDDSGSGGDHFAGFGRARHHGAVEGRPDGEVLTILLRLAQLRLGLVRTLASALAISACCCAICLRTIATCDSRMLGIVRFAWAVVSAPRASFHPPLCSRDRRRLLIGRCNACFACRSETAPVLASRVYASLSNAAI